MRQQKNYVTFGFTLSLGASLATVLHLSVVTVVARCGVSSTDSEGRTCGPAFAASGAAIATISGNRNCRQIAAYKGASAESATSGVPTRGISTNPAISTLSRATASSGCVRRSAGPAVSGVPRRRAANSALPAISTLSITARHHRRCAASTTGSAISYSATTATITAVAA